MGKSFRPNACRHSDHHLDDLDDDLDYNEKHSQDGDLFVIDFDQIGFIVTMVMMMTTIKMSTMLTGPVPSGFPSPRKRDDSRPPGLLLASLAFEPTYNNSQLVFDMRNR